MERRRRRKCPFQRGGADAPWIIPGHPLLRESVDHSVKEDNHAESGDVGAIGRDHVPAMECVRIVNNTAGHPGETKEVLWGEKQGNANEGGREVGLSKGRTVNVYLDL